MDATQRTKYAVSGHTKLYRVPTESHSLSLLGVARGLGGGSLGGGGNDPLLIKSLEERLDNGPIGDLSTLKRD